MIEQYKICERCVMDTSVPDIKFYEDGRCSLCKHYDDVLVNEIHDDEVGKRQLESLVSQIKRSSSPGKYDCVIGVSGGVDSSYVAHLVTKVYGLRPLAVHLDNGWNTELATANVESLVKKLNIDLYTEVLRWSEFRDIQASFIKASVSNIEIPTDHAIWATLVRIASRENIKFIFAGNNVVTESIMPSSWLYGSKDFRFIKAIHKQFGRVKLKSYPHLSLINYVWYFLLKKIRWVPVLNYLTFVKVEAKQFLMKEYGWRDYGGKHYESIFTRFFHAYYLPEKFNYDLRRSYNSALICSGQLSREDALLELEIPPAPSEVLEQDRSYVIKKLGFSEEEFSKIMNAPHKTEADYANNDRIWERFSSIVSWARNRITRVE
jgi:N-acetyl sugar amidotransferase